MELPINKYYIEEIKYRLNDKKDVIFKMHNFMLEDVEVIEKKELAKHENASTEKPKDTVADEKTSLLDRFEKQRKKMKYIINEMDSEITKEKKPIAVKKDSVLEHFEDKKERYDQIVKAVDKMPYKVYDKIGSASFFEAAKGKPGMEFFPEPDKYVTDDERELPKVIQGLKKLKEKHEAEKKETESAETKE